MPDRHHPFDRDEVFPSYFVNALQAVLSSASFQFTLRKANATTIEVPADLGNALVAVFIEGNFRYTEATVQRAHPGGGAGLYDIFATASEDNIVSAPQPYTDLTDYSFALAIVPTGDEPAIVPGTVDVFRKVGEVQWSGTEISEPEQTLPTTLPPPAPIAALAQIVKQRVRAGSTANVTLSGSQTVDTVSLNAGDRVLVKNQTTPTENGIYVVAGGAWARSADADADADFEQGQVILVDQGGQRETAWQLSTDSPVTLGTSAIAYSPIPLLATEVIKGSSRMSLAAESATDPISVGDNDPRLKTWKTAVRAASTANVTVASPGGTIDTVALAAGDRVLLKDQTTASQNGAYVWNGSAVPMTRAIDADAAAEFNLGQMVAVMEGTDNHDTGWWLTTNAPIVPGVTALAYVKVWEAITAGAPPSGAATLVAYHLDLPTSSESISSSSYVWMPTPDRVTVTVPVAGASLFVEYHTLVTSADGEAAWFVNGTQAKDAADNQIGRTIAPGTLRSNGSPGSNGLIVGTPSSVFPSTAFFPPDTALMPIWGVPAGSYEVGVKFKKDGSANPARSKGSLSVIVLSAEA